MSILEKPQINEIIEYNIVVDKDNTFPIFKNNDNKFKNQQQIIKQSSNNLTNQSTKFGSKQFESLNKISKCCDTENSNYLFIKESTNQNKVLLSKFTKKASNSNSNELVFNNGNISFQEKSMENNFHAYKNDKLNKFYLTSRDYSKKTLKSIYTPISNDTIPHKINAKSLKRISSFISKSFLSKCAMYKKQSNVYFTPLARYNNSRKKSMIINIPVSSENKLNRYQKDVAFCDNNYSNIDFDIEEARRKLYEKELNQNDLDSNKNNDYNQRRITKVNRRMLYNKENKDYKNNELIILNDNKDINNHSSSEESYSHPSESYDSDQYIKYIRYNSCILYDNKLNNINDSLHESDYNNNKLNIRNNNINCNNNNKIQDESMKNNVKEYCEFSNKSKIEYQISSKNKDIVEIKENSDKNSNKNFNNDLSINKNNRKKKSINCKCICNIF